MRARLRLLPRKVRCHRPRLSAATAAILKPSTIITPRLSLARKPLRSERLTRGQKARVVLIASDEHGRHQQENTDLLRVRGLRAHKTHRAEGEQMPLGQRLLAIA